MSNLIKDIANSERPYEKAVEHGIEALTDAELLAVILRNGTKDTSAIDLANRILNMHLVYDGLISLNYLTREELKSIQGIGDVKATQLLAVVELSKRISLSTFKKNIVFDSSDTISRYYIEKCRFLTREKTYLLMLAADNSLIKEINISEGTINEAHMSPREVYVLALKYEAVSIIIVHNHPSGNVNPSEADINVTNRLVSCGKLLGIRLLDHIIVGRAEYYSMFERGLI